MHGNYGWTKGKLRFAMQPAKNYGWSKGKKLRLEEGKLSVGMQPEITPLRLRQLVQLTLRSREISSDFTVTVAESLLRDHGRGTFTVADQKPPNLRLRSNRCCVRADVRIIYYTNLRDYGGNPLRSDLL